jgi:hypothetical protein
MIAPLNKKKFEVFTDPDHTWIKVRIKFLEDLIGDDWRTYFSAKNSCERADFVYLEEDEDTATFHHYLKGKGIQPELDYKEHKTDRPSKLRGYAPLAPMDQ